ncbi:hypothetical protein A5888_002657 [Enterococcus sp. 9E7_DIV0242]|uniref:Uncharacterized protein n=1 Tax=Candidatus Enterococcus clewellii TaxID=1834193 RepID=A0A242K805_9ENTE|nr:hypothetical protein A5888_001420 [Enterococcus sp. 9E7_DIV0242]
MSYSMFITLLAVGIIAMFVYVAYREKKGD